MGEAMEENPYKAPQKDTPRGKTVRISPTLFDLVLLLALLLIVLLSLRSR
jgi:hypothetical protein